MKKKIYAVMYYNRCRDLYYGIVSGVAGQFLDHSYCTPYNFHRSASHALRKAQKQYGYKHSELFIVSLNSTKVPFGDWKYIRKLNLVKFQYMLGSNTAATKTKLTEGKNV